MFGINPAGFEEHKKSLTDLEEVDLINRFVHVVDGWLIYTVLVLEEEVEEAAAAAPAVKKQKKAA